MGNIKNDLTWKKLFEKYNVLGEILKEGAFEITAKKSMSFRKQGERESLPWGQDKQFIVQ